MSHDTAWMREELTNSNNFQAILLYAKPFHRDQSTVFIKHMFILNGTLCSSITPIVNRHVYLSSGRIRSFRIEYYDTYDLMMIVIMMIAVMMIIIILFMEKVQMIILSHYRTLTIALFNGQCLNLTLRWIVTRICFIKIKLAFVFN